MHIEPQEYSFRRYLAAKKDLDGRSLNRHVRETLSETLLERGSAPCRVLEVGCGIGTMLERLIDWQLLTDAAYTGIDVHPDNIGEARLRFRRYAAARGADLSMEAGRFLFRQPWLTMAVEFETIDLFHFLAREQGRQRRFDFILAHAFLDLVDLETALPGLLGLLAPGGLFYFTLNFDGSTIFQPTIDPGLDRLIETLYHQSMDQRQVGGRPAGSSHTGRRLFENLLGRAKVMAAGSSDWVVFPGPDGYPNDEAYFLHFIIHTVHQALTGHPELPEADFRTWVEKRHAQIQQRELVYIARQLDFFGQV